MAFDPFLDESKIAEEMEGFVVTGDDEEEGEGEDDKSKKFIAQDFKILIYFL